MSQDDPRPRGGDPRVWWRSLRHEGSLIAPRPLARYFDGEPPPVERGCLERLRAELERVHAGEDRLGVLLDGVFELLGFPTTSWLRQPDASWTQASSSGEGLSPERIWQGPRGEPLPVFTVAFGGPRRRASARVIEWLRRAERPLALVTDGGWLRLIHASPDHAAVCEWDLRECFAGTEPSLQLVALRRLLDRGALEQALLLRAIEESRAAQSELSAVLGERVREAVELLIRASSKALEPEAAEPKAIYMAAARIVMRLVVVAFGEARDMLPRDNPAYRDRFGLHELGEQLARGDAAGSGHGAWARILGLFRLLHAGSSEAALPLRGYGGGLFRPGEGRPGDPIARALARFEGAADEVTDQQVLELLRLLTRDELDEPVDFAELDTEYIGVLYEGLLDYELRRAPASDPVVFLNLGDQPAFRLAQLVGLSGKARARLLAKLGKPANAACEAELPARVHAWACEAVGQAGWVRGPVDESELVAAARRLVARVVAPGEWYLVRWGGTRKGAGSFYTPPQLARPTVRRSLQPLAYEAVDAVADPETGLVEVRRWVVKPPAEILALKVCDPAMGSGSFLVAAIGFLTRALRESLDVHGCIVERGAHTLVRLADADDLLPVALDDDELEPLLETRLKRHVVERCIYGVDLDPLAVELARLSLWIETMDPRLPFDFLDHKLRCGNSLVGCWVDRFEHYPLLAWERKIDGFTDSLTRRKLMIKAELVGQIQARACADERVDARLAEVRERFAKIHRRVDEPQQRARLYAELRASTQPLREAFDGWCALWFWPGEMLEHAPGPETLRAPSPEARAVIERLRDELRFFHWELEFFDVFDGPNSGFDAILGNPPWDIQKPNSREFFSHVEPRYRSFTKQEALRWQAEAFARDPALEREWVAYQGRFKSMSHWVRAVAEPFGDPTSTPGGKRVALARKGNAGLHRAWRAQRCRREGYADPEHPFRHQGSADLNSYKLFVELGYALCKRGGRIGLVVPSGLYTDRGTAALRELLLERCRWEWLFGFDNRAKIFAIDNRFEFAVIVAEKGGRTTALRSAFMRRSLADWEAARARTLAYPRARISQFSPGSKTILEVSAARDLDILRRLYDNGVALGERGPEGWGIEYVRELDMTNDSRLFPPRAKWEAQGYRADEYGHWLAGNWRPYAGPTSVLERERWLVLSRDRTHAIALSDIEDAALPVYQGAMIQQLDWAAAGFVEGQGWRAQGWEAKAIEPRYLLGRADFLARAKARKHAKLAFRDIARATDTRTVIATILDGVPCGNTLGVFCVPAAKLLAFAGLCNSWVFDWATRQRLGGTHLNLYVAEDLPLPVPARAHGEALVAALACGGVQFARIWREHGRRDRGWRSRWALTEHERLRVRAMLDALAAFSFGLSREELAWILAGCDLPVAATSSASQRRAKGFWRVDKHKPPQLRHSVLSQVAFAELERLGPTEFLAQNDGEGWMLPARVRLADYGLGHDERAQQHEPVAELLGPRWLDGQLDEDLEASWAECERHAELLDAIVPSQAAT